MREGADEAAHDLLETRIWRVAIRRNTSSVILFSFRFRMLPQRIWVEQRSPRTQNQSRHFGRASKQVRGAHVFAELWSEAQCWKHCIGELAAAVCVRVKLLRLPFLTDTCPQTSVADLTFLLSLPRVIRRNF